MCGVLIATLALVVGIVALLYVVTEETPEDR